MATFVSGFVVGFTAVWQLALVTLAVIPMIAVIGAIHTTTLAKLSGKSLEALSQAGNIVEQMVVQIRVVLAFVGESRALLSFEQPFQNIIQAMDVGQSILESYSRVMESLAFNIMARIDYVLYVDDTIKRCAAADSISLFSRGGFGGLPIQKRMSPSPFSIQHTPYASPFATPTFWSSSPCSPQITTHAVKRNAPKEATGSKAKMLASADFERVWSYSYTGNLSARRASGDAPERDSESEVNMIASIAGHQSSHLLKADLAKAFGPAPLYMRV